MKVGFRTVSGSLFSILVAGIVGLALIFALALRHEKMIHAEWMAPLLWLAGSVAVVELLRRRCRDDGLPAEEVRPLAGVLVLFGLSLLYCFSSAARFKWFYFLDWAPPVEAGLLDFNSGIGHWTLLTLLSLPLLLFPSRRLNWILLSMLIVAQAAALFLFLESTHGFPLFNDDHSSFIYRLWIFGQCFPRLINYSPVWNAGSLEIAGVSTGANAPGLLFWPLWKFASVPEFYSFALGILYAVLVPALAVVSVRIMGFGRTPSWVAGLLALGVSRYYFLWLLHYGTIGANLTSAFIMPAAACLYRVVILNRMEKVTGLALVVSMLFLWMWPPGLVITVPLLLVFLLHARHWSRPKLLFLAVCGAVALVLFLYPLILLLQATDVVTHDWLHPKSSAGGLVHAVVAGWQFLLEHCRQANPLLLFLGIGGLTVTAKRPLRNWFLPILLFLAFMAGWGPGFVRDIQPERMAIPLFFAAVIPTAVLIADILNTRHLWLAIVRAAVFALLIMSGWNAVWLFAGEGEAGFAYEPPAIRQLISWVKHHTDHGDRIMLAGGTSHYYEGGHVAGLSVLCNREMLASEYKHDQIKALRYGCPPENPPPPAGLDSYLELYAVRTVITPHDEWKLFFRADPARYREMLSFHGDDSTVTVFQVRSPSPVFASGRGLVRAEMNALNVTLENPAEEAVIRYNWVDGLSASEAEIYPVEAGEGVRLIGIRSHGPSRVHIRFRRWL